MSSALVTVSVGVDGSIAAAHWQSGAAESGRVVFGGLDAELIQHFERWMMLRDVGWRTDEIRAFGSLLHRYLFPRNVWVLIRDLLSETDQPLRLRLKFPLAGPYARLAAIPWEYLYTREETGYPGFFLADHGSLVLSRYVPPVPQAAALRPAGPMKMMTVISRPPDPLLGPVEADDVLAEVEQTAKDLDVPFEPVLRNPTADQLGHELAERKPHVLHFMGHGRFDADQTEGALAFTTAAGDDSDWVNESRLVSMMQNARTVPRIVVLHACEGGATDFAERFAGVGPSLLRGGVAAVVAMQYRVTNDTAIAFSCALYRDLRAGTGIDHAVQAGRRTISGGQDGDPRLRGIPVVYLDGSRVYAEE